uniref:Uncharacterized protein n=1 Tax=Cyanoptyche gloeocystis TaxID=77922 RepID=A0A7S2JQK2_9EUKA
MAMNSKPNDSMRRLDQHTRNEEENRRKEELRKKTEIQKIVLLMAEKLKTGDDEGFMEIYDSIPTYFDRTEVEMMKQRARYHAGLSSRFNWEAVLPPDQPFDKHSLPTQPSAMTKSAKQDGMRTAKEKGGRYERDRSFRRSKNPPVD